MSQISWSQIFKRKVCLKINLKLSYLHFLIWALSTNFSPIKIDTFWCNVLNETFPVIFEHRVVQVSLGDNYSQHSLPDFSKHLLAVVVQILCTTHSLLHFCLSERLRTFISWWKTGRARKINSYCHSILTKNPKNIIKILSKNSCHGY